MRQHWLTHLPPTAPAALAPWLTHPGSLTARLREHFAHFNVRVLRQCRARPHEDERALLGLRPGELAWVREVLLCAGDTPLVFAHSVLPLGHVRGAWNLFAGLGARPLGEVLFTDPGIARGRLNFRRLDERHPLHRAGTAPLWARRSLFHRSRRALLVTEVFLPALLNPSL